MSETAARIVGFERRVMWRMRLLALLDSLGVALTIAGLTAGGIVVIVRLRPMTIPVWPVVTGMLSLSIAAAVIRWFLARSGEADAAFLIDESLKLDDRIASSRLIIERGGPTGGLEEALIEDAAARVKNQTPASIAPFRTRRWYPLALVSAIGLVVALMIPPRLLPVDAALSAERADIAAAGEHLEQTAAKIEQSVPGSDTATLAQEQAEVGRSFRRAGASRAEALKRLSALEERIRERRNDLSNTRADEIVSLADRRLRDALSTVPKTGRTQSYPDDGSFGTPPDEPRGAPKQVRVTTPNSNGSVLESRTEDARPSDARGSRSRTTAKTEQVSTDAADDNSIKKAEPQKRPQEPVLGQDNRSADLAKAPTAGPGESVATDATDKNLRDPSAGDPKTDGERTTGQNIDERRADERETSSLPAGSLEALKAVPDSLAQQATRALPELSEELLKKAAELRANELKPGDIEKLKKAAEFLARDLEQIGQSKQLQQALKEMARQIRPEQIEQVARELDNQEGLKRELEAAARLLSENQQAKEMVAGLTGRMARRPDQRERRNNKVPGGEPGVPYKEAQEGEGASGSNRDVAGGTPEKLETADRRLVGQGRESGLKGKLRERTGGEYLYLQSKAGAGATRVPYSSAYPLYRREAERSVQRSQVPPNLRSVVRKYFDAINPDGKK